MIVNCHNPDSMVNAVFSRSPEVISSWQYPLLSPRSRRSSEYCRACHQSKKKINNYLYLQYLSVQSVQSGWTVLLLDLCHWWESKPTRWLDNIFDVLEYLFRFLSFGISTDWRWPCICGIDFVPNHLCSIFSSFPMVKILQNRRSRFLIFFLTRLGFSKKS